MGRRLLVAGLTIVLAGIAPARSARASGPSPGVLYSQYDDVLNTYVTSQELTPDPNLDNDEAADDFTVPDGTSWLINSVTIRGDWNYLTHPLRSFNVRFYGTSGGLPGTLQRSFLQASFTQSVFDITVSLGAGAALGPGHYWVSVQAVVLNNSGSEWFNWANRGHVSGSGAAWHNIGNGYGTGCIAWTIKTSCWGTDGPDQVFSLSGFDVPVSADYRMEHSRLTSAWTAPTFTDLVGASASANTFAQESVFGAPHTVLRFPKDNGLSISPTNGIVPNDSYTIAMLFRLQDVGTWRRVIDFKNGTSDNGLYITPGNLLAFAPVKYGSTTIAANQWVQVVVTRDVSGLVNVYLNSSFEMQFSDAGNDAVISPANALRLFQDNTSGGSTGEDSAGAVARVRLYDYALSPAGVAALDPLPPPAAITASAPSGAAGSSVTVSGTDYGPKENVRISYVDAAKVSTLVATVKTTTPGAFSTSVTVPAGAAPGKGAFRVVGAKSKLVARRAFTVT